MTPSSTHLGSQEESIQPRQAWLAAILSLVLPGFGQLYNGQVNKALTVFLLFITLGVPVVAIIALYSPTTLTAPLLALCTIATVLVWIYAVVDAWSTARKRRVYLVEPWQTGSVYSGVFALTSFVLLPLIVTHVRGHHVQPFSIPSGSMQPTLEIGDQLFASMRYNCSFCSGVVRRGDVAIFIYPDLRNAYHVKRVIGLPGDTVSIDSGIVSVNGASLSGSVGTVSETIEGRSWQVISTTNENTERRTVAPGHVFLLGDNRNNSRDSRHYGEVPLSDVVGRPRQIWFSKGEEGIRWERLGTELQP